jgi:hypothetical protein
LLAAFLRWLVSEGEMRNGISKAIAAGVTALSVGAAAIGTAEPASAQYWHGGGGGWHGGGAWHGGGWHGGGWGPGWHGGGVWHPGYWRGGSWYNGWWGPAVVAGLAAGAIATAPYWGSYGYGYGDYGYSSNCWQVRPVYSAAGVYLGNQPVNVCQ